MKQNKKKINTQETLQYFTFHFAGLYFRKMHGKMNQEKSTFKL